MTLKNTLGSGRGCRAFALLLLAACGAEPELVDESTCLPQEVFRIDRVDLPANNLDARNFARDLGGDKALDNQLGSVSATLSSMFNIPFASRASDRLAADVVWMIAMRRCGDRLVVNLTNGEPSGDELQLIDASATPLIATSSNGDSGVIPLGTLFDAKGTGEPAFLPALVGEVALDDAATGNELHATLAMALAHPEARETVIAAMTPWIIEQAEAADSALLRYFDTFPQDGHVTAEEIRMGEVTEYLLASDILANDEPANSIGLRIHATRVR